RQASRHHERGRAPAGHRPCAGQGLSLARSCDVGMPGLVPGIPALKYEPGWPGRPRPSYATHGIDPDMKARVTVTLKSGILDPQGKAVEGALRALGLQGVTAVRQGKVFDIELEGSDKAKAEALLKQ